MLLPGRTSMGVIIVMSMDNLLGNSFGNYDKNAEVFSNMNLFVNFDIVSFVFVASVAEWTSRSSSLL